MKKIITLNLDVEIIKKLDEVAESERRSRSKMVEYIIEKYLKKGE